MIILRCFSFCSAVYASGIGIAATQLVNIYDFREVEGVYLASPLEMHVLFSAWQAHENFSMKEIFRLSICMIIFV